REDERKLRIVFDNPAPGVLQPAVYEQAVRNKGIRGYIPQADDAIGDKNLGAVWGCRQEQIFGYSGIDRGQHRGAPLRGPTPHPSELTLGEAYIYDDFDIEGDIE